jgi:hypothetical protein
MTDINHRRHNRKPVNQRYNRNEYHNGYPVDDGQRGNIQRVGNTDYLDKSMHSWGRTSKFADAHIGAAIGNDFNDGHRGMAGAVKGAKKFVRSRIRFHDKSETKKLAQSFCEDDAGPNEETP